jgi:hypothetical protein
MRYRLRSIPRSDGRTSVVLTREPASPADPLVLHVCPTARQAVERIMDHALQLVRKHEERFVQYEGHYLIRADLSCSASATVEVEDEG